MAAFLEFHRPIKPCLSQSQRDERRGYDSHLNYQQIIVEPKHFGNGKSIENSEISFS